MGITCNMHYLILTCRDLIAMALFMVPLQYIIEPMNTKVKN